MSPQKTFIREPSFIILNLIIYVILMMLITSCAVNREKKEVCAHLPLVGA